MSASYLRPTNPKQLGGTLFVGEGHGVRIAGLDAEDEPGRRPGIRVGYGEARQRGVHRENTENHGEAGPSRSIASSVGNTSLETESAATRASCGATVE